MATTRTLTIFINGKEVENNLKSIRAEYVKLYNETAKMNKGAEGYAEKVAELKRTKGILDEHRAQLSGTAKTWDKLKDGVAKFTPYVAGAFAAFKVGEKIINSAQGASDKWEASLTGLKWGLDSVMKSIATFDFSNFFENITKSIKAGKEYAQVLDDLGDRNRAYRVKESELRIEIEKQERIRDNVLLSNKERLNAALEIDRLEGESLKSNNELKQTAFDNEVMRLRTITGLNDEKIKSFIKEYEEQKNVRDEAERYGETLLKIQELRRRATSVSPEGIVMVDQSFFDAADDLQKQANATSETVKTYYDILQRIGKTTDEELDKAVQSWVDYNGAELNYMQNTQKNERKINDLKKSFSEEEQKRAEEARKRAEALAKKLEEIQYKLNQYYQASNYNELQDAHKKYAELRAEAQGNSDTIIKINELEKQEISQINDKYKKQLIDDFNKTADEFDKLLEAEAKAFKESVNNSKELSDQNKELIKSWLDQWRTEFNAVADKDIFGMTKDDWDALIENFNVVISLASEALNAYSAYNDYLTNQEEAELNRYEENNEKKKESLQKRLDAGLLDEKTYNRAIANYDAELDKKKQEIAEQQAERERTLKSFQAVINTAAAIIGFLANPGGYAGIALAAAAGITGAIQVAAINSAEAFADGGRIKKRTFAMMGEAGEEGVISNRTLNNSTTGPIANWLLDTQQGLNPRFPATVAPTTPQVSSYGATATMATISQPQVVVQPADNSELLSEIRKMNEYLADPKNRQAYISKDILAKDSEEENFRTSIQKLK